MCHCVWNALTYYYYILHESLWETSDAGGSFVSLYYIDLLMRDPYSTILPAEINFQFKKFEKIVKNCILLKKFFFIKRALVSEQTPLLACPLKKFHK